MSVLTHPTDETDVVGGTTTSPTAPARGPRQRTPETAAPRRSAARWALAHGHVLAAIAVIAVLHALSLEGTRFTADEGTYYSQALSFITDGRLSPYTYWYDHPPVGWVQLAPFVGLVDLLGNPWSPAVAARAIMVVFAAATAGMIYAVGRSLRLSRGASLVATLLWGLSPLAAQLSGQFYLDNVGTPWLLAALWLALNRRQDMFLHLLAGVAFAVAVLTKETYVLALPGVVLALLRSVHPSNRVFSLAGFALSFVMTGLLYPLLAINRSELLPGEGHVSLLEGIVWQLSSREGSGWMFTPGTDAHVTLTGWLAVDPILLVAGVAACVLTLLSARLRPLGLIAVVMVVVAIRPSGYLPLMFVIGLLPFCALALAGVVDAALARLRIPAVRVLAGVLLVVVAATWLAGPWTPQWRAALTRNHNVAYHEAVDEIARTIPQDSVIVTDDVIWNELVAAGRDDDGWSGPIWFPKYQLDPVAAEKHGIDGWRDVDYVVSSDSLRSTLEGADRMEELMSHTELVERIGSGEHRLEILRVRKDS